jgi:hypothetical protein
MIKFPKPIIQKIISYIDFDTLLMNPLKILCFMTIGIDSSDYRKKIWNEYFNKMLENTIIDNVKVYKILDDNLYDSIYNSKIDSYKMGKYKQVNYTKENYKIYESRYEEYEKNIKFMGLKLLKLKGKKFVHETDDMCIYFRIHSNLYRINYIVNSFHISSLCPPNTSDKTYCDTCYSDLLDDECQGVEIIKYNEHIDNSSIKANASMKNLKLFFSHIRQLKDLKDIQDKMKEQPKLEPKNTDMESDREINVILFDVNLKLYKEIKFGFIIRLTRHNTIHVVGKEEDNKVRKLTLDEIIIAQDLGLEIL